MKREEAIELLKNLKVCKQAHTLFNIEKEAVDMAIEALKEETKKCPICGSDLYEYCFMCCYEGEKVKKNESTY